MKESSVLVVGAGPTGLILALSLKKQGINVRIIDKSQEPGLTSRAVVIHARTLELYDQLGLTAVPSLGIKVQRAEIQKNGKLLTSLSFGDIGAGLSPHPFALCFPQDHHEAFLIEQLRMLGVEVEREVALVDLYESHQKVRATISRKLGQETWEVDYVAGCDGAASRVRHLLDIEFPGGTYQHRFFVADLELEDRAQHVVGRIRLCLEKFRFAAMFPVREGSERLVGLVPDNLIDFQQLSFESLRPTVEKLLGVCVQKVNWFSTYHVHHRVAHTFRKGRVFLLGDAAHIHSPAGGQGMNTGVGDAVNLGWKLAQVLKGEAPARLLDTYEVERRAFALLLVKTTDKVFQIMSDMGWKGYVWRDWIIPFVGPILTRCRAFRKWFFMRISQIRLHYRTSPLSVGAAGQLHAGERLPWVPQEEGDDNYTSLKSQLWQVHVYGNVRLDFADAAARFNIPIYTFPWSHLAKQAGLVRDAVYLVRPDGYLGFVSHNQEVRPFEGYVTSWLVDK